MERNYKRNHLLQDQIQPLDQAPHPGSAQDNETSREYQRDAQALCGEPQFIFETMGLDQIRLFTELGLETVLKDT